ncbi:MAG: hypothetical protein GXP13_04800 [Gammaproteobacteria bacterium]|nr:hypothetical protein [Gammaproteobacteria bacterium]
MPLLQIPIENTTHDRIFAMRHNMITTDSGLQYEDLDTSMKEDSTCK